MAHGPLDFDVVIIGGGPAGAATGAYLARAGVRCAIIERDIFPRFHIGESFVPSSTRVFNEIGVLEDIERAGFLRKVGAAWTAVSGGRVFQDRVHYPANDESLSAGAMAEIRFAEREQPGVDQPYTYHVPRDKFDLLLLQHAHRSGAQVYEGLAVRRVEFHDEDGVDVVCAMGNREVRLGARFVVDASGRKTVLGNQLKLKVLDPVFNQYALHAWFDGYDRAGWDQHTFVHFLPITNSWVWQIPITDTVTSIGVVTQRKHFSASRQSREQFFWDCIGSRPDMLERVKRAEQVRPICEEGDYSYAMKQIAGDRFVLIGDAARFVDPIFSSGVSIALNGARFASLNLLQALAGGDLSRAAFAEYEAVLRRGTRNWHEFISLYYRLNVLFTAFILDVRYRLDVLKLLQGDLYDEDEPPVLCRMRDIVTAVENNPRHVWHKHLGDLTSYAFRPAF